MSVSLNDQRWTAMRTKTLDDVAPFVIAVKSTGIYCRVGCPARSPLPQNVTFLDSITEAEAAGFRACKRCRPEQGDLTPWQPKAQR